DLAGRSQPVSIFLKFKGIGALPPALFLILFALKLALDFYRILRRLTWLGLYISRRETHARRKNRSMCAEW
ncbi:MAG: hypothetical protein AB1798_23885, partial [Spirochaetota bacterium]